ncbi:MAG TPA: porin [Tepidisphaeraceae bacterium]|nr:porin [Tepidisphaeraceae bacterium]
MTRRVRHPLVILAGLLAVGVLGAGRLFAADDSPASRDQLLQQIESLKARVAQLEASQQQALNARDVDQTVERVLRDAERRSKLLADAAGLTAGFDKGKFFLRSEDGNWLLMPGFLFQTRYTANFNTDGDDDINSGFEIRRMRLILSGNAVSPDLKYFFQWETNSTSGNLFLLDAWARYKLAANLNLQVGQFKDTVHQEQRMADELLLTERSLINALIGGGNIDRVQGAMLMYDDGQHLQVNLAAHDGYNSKNTDFTDSGAGTAFVGVTDLNFGFSARANYFVTGTPRQYDDFTAMGNTQDLLVIGAGMNWSQGGDSDVIFHTIDAQWENAAGLGVYAALYGMWRDIGDGTAIPDGDYYDYGAQLQAGYLLARRCEVFGRYDYIALDDGALAAGAEDTLHELTVGTNYYYHGHNAKLTLDLSWLPSGSPTSVGGLGVVAGDEDQLILRLQAQLFL